MAKKAHLKTQKNNASVEDFLHSVKDQQKQADSFTILKMMKEITGEKPMMWGDSIIGFGEYEYTYSSGRTGDWFLTGFSPRKQNLTLYIMKGFDGYEDLLKKIGPHKTSISCLYIKRLSDIDLKALHTLIATSYKEMKNNPKMC